MRFASIPTETGPILCPELLVSTPNTPLYSLQHFETVPQPQCDPNFEFDPQLQAFLTGRHLLIDELHFPLETIQKHYANGYLAYEKGITKTARRYSCERCGNNDQAIFAQFSCYRCKEPECTYCRKCIMMGRVSECTPLIRWTGPPPDILASDLVWNGTLSDLQQNASDHIIDLVGQARETLIWAVCGAGKTEILFAGIERALQLGLRVCLASPRTDVITELYPRFEQAFPGAGVIALYGGHSELTTPSPLILSTTHQLFRFKEAFDVIIVDEVDAFPFSYDRTLRFAVEKAAKVQATKIYLSATPSAEMKQRARSGNLDVIHISRRFHGYPLPVPTFKWCGNWEKRIAKGKIPSAVQRWIKVQLDSGRQSFLFVPTIKDMNAMFELIEENPDIESVHANDPDRNDKIMRFRKGDIRMLLSTTILERGVTVPEIDVAVLGADHEVFSANALVQIAGRVGRSVEDPYGEVVYFHYGKSRAMVAARREIEAHNRRAGVEG